ncbi:MAG: GDP-L-fucose synthase [Actinomycetes bacterium]
MTILVAGATGLVGSAIVREFERVGKSVKGISSKDVDLLDRNATFSYLADFKPAIVIDAAARVGGIGANNSHPVDFLTKNIQIQSNLMDAAHQARVKNFVFLGSSCIYPRNCAQPIKEEYILTGELEKTNSAYAIAKIAGLELIKSYRKQFGHKWISVMPTNLYGPNDNFDLENSHVFPALIRKFVEGKRNNSASVTLWGSGSPKREFLHVDDLAKAILVCLEKYDSDQHINIGTGEDLEIKALANKISKAAGFTGEVIWDSNKPDGTPRKVLDISKITNLGWKPSISLDSGIAQTVQWYQENK